MLVYTLEIHQFNPKWDFYPETWTLSVHSNQPTLGWRFFFCFFFLTWSLFAVISQFGFILEEAHDGVETLI